MDKEKVVLINTCINKIKDGEDESLLKLHDLIGPSLRYIALKYLRNEYDSDDLVQDFWLNIRTIASKFAFATNGFSFLCKIMTRMAINRYHKLKRDQKFKVDFVDYSNIEDYSQDDGIENSMLRESINQSMNSLTKEERIIIQLTYFEDKTIRQIGKEMGISKSQVNRFLINAREKMKSQLEDLLWDKTES